MSADITTRGRCTGRYGARTATLTIHAPTGVQPQSFPDVLAAGIDWWPLKMARELDDAILMLEEQRAGSRHMDIEDPGRRNPRARGRRHARHPSRSLVRTRNPGAATAYARPARCRSRTLFAVIDEGSCFAGTLLELALAADRTYMLSVPDHQDAPRLALSSLNLVPILPLPGRVASRRASTVRHR